MSGGTAEVSLNLFQNFRKQRLALNRAAWQITEMQISVLQAGLSLDAISSGSGTGSSADLC